MALSDLSIKSDLELLQVGTQLDGSEDRALILWPVTICHLIDKESPLWKLSPRDLLNSNFEIVVTLEGSAESTGNTAQVGNI